MENKIPSASELNMPLYKKTNYEYSPEASGTINNKKSNKKDSYRATNILWFIFSSAVAKST